MYDSISVQSKAERDTFEGVVTLPNGSTFDHRKTLKMIGYHKLGQFYECDDADMIFYPLGQKRAPHFCKKLDADTKDYNITAEGGNYQGSWIANIRFGRWMKDSGFALDLNDLSEACGEVGSAVLKRTPGVDTKNDLGLCNLLYLWFDPTVEHIEDSPIIELHQLTELQIRSKKGWKNVDEALKKAERVELDQQANPGSLVIQKYKIWERSGEFQKKDKRGKLIDKDPKYYHTIFCGYGTDEVILFEEEIKPEDCLYYDFHISKYEDRWLRVGVYERLFGLQQLVNELVNQNREANTIASLLLLYSRDKSLIGRNALQEAFSGMILDTNSLAQVPIDNRFLSGFLAELMRYEMKADELCMTPEVVTGEKMPSGATFRGQAVLTNVANDAFDNARDRIHTRLAEKLLRDILPDLMDNWNKEDVLEISANEEAAKMFDTYTLRYKVNEFIKSQWEQGENPSPAEIDKFKEQTLTSWDTEGRKIIGLKGFFNFKHSLKFNPTGESANKEQKNEVFNNVLLMIKDIYPTAFESILKEYLEYNGMSPIRLSPEEMNRVLQNLGNTQPGNRTQSMPMNKPDKMMAAING